MWGRLIKKKLLATVTDVRNYNLSCLVTVSRFFIAGIKEIMAKVIARCYLRNVCLICIYRFSPSPIVFPVTFIRVGRLTHSCCPCPLPYRGALLSNERRRVPNATFNTHDGTRRRSVCLEFVCLKIRKRKIDRLTSTFLLSITLQYTNWWKKIGRKERESKR
jgi:hypothetical protein